MLTRGRGELGTVLKSMTPKAWPAEATQMPVPWEAFLGFTAISQGPSELTSASERGYFQTPTSSWNNLASTTYVKDLLGGRAATTDPNAWPTAISDQCAIGFGDLRAHLRTVNNTIGVELAGLRLASSWSVACAFMGFSAGSGAAAKWILMYKQRLATIPEAVRWAVLGNLIIADIDSGAASSWARGSHKNPGASYSRTTQKLECGLLAARELGDGESYAAWYGRPDCDFQKMVDASF